MNQFDVIANPFPRSQERQPFLVVLQSDLLTRTLSTTVVAPLEPAGGQFADRLNPTVTVEGKSFCLIVQELATVRRSVLSDHHGSVAAERDKIIAALDMLFTGI